ncbi:MAG: hypothetical protein ACRDWT_03220 [Jatrophihabitantaceae bacterium]
MNNQLITPMAALRSGAAVSFRVPADVPAAWPTETATAGHVSAGFVGTGVVVGMSAGQGSVQTDPVLRPTAIDTAKQARPPRGIPR